MFSSPTSQPSKQIFFRDPSEESLVWGRTCRTTDVLMDMLYLSWDAIFFYLKTFFLIFFLYTYMKESVSGSGTGSLDSKSRGPVRDPEPIL